MLGQLDIYGRDKVEVAIQRLKTFEPEDGYYVGFSGGKDSQCVYHLCKMAGVKFDAHYSVTSVDPPELMRFVKEHYPDVIWERPRDENGKQITMWTLIANSKIPPTRFARYCCEKLKEAGGDGRVTVTGVRWAESNNRKMNQGLVTVYGKVKSTQKTAAEAGAEYRVTPRGGIVMNMDNADTRRAVEMCYRTRHTIVNPIIDWDDSDVWEFIKDYAKIPYCHLYDEGWNRLGCIGCPLAGSKKMKRDFKKYPLYERNYKNAMRKIFEKHPDYDMRTMHRYCKSENPTIDEKVDAMFKWWLRENSEEVEV